MIYCLCSGRRRAGEDLPPPPKTALAGPEYFGLIHPDTIAKIETLDPDQSCTTYWAGKQERFAFGQVSMPLQKSHAWYPCSFILDPNSAGACSGDVLLASLWMAPVVMHTMLSGIHAAAAADQSSTQTASVMPVLSSPANSLLSRLVLCLRNS